jgi:chemotaxis protein MotB
MDTIKSEMVTESTSMYDQVSDLTEQYNLEDYVELNIDPDYHFVQLTLMGSVLYDSGSADIKDGAKPVLTKIGELLDKFEGYNVEIVGHTDNVPMSGSTYKDNNWLSSARALNAAEYLIDSCGIDPAFLKYSGRGEYEPISSNATAEGRAKNRRIEIKIYNKLATGN